MEKSYDLLCREAVMHGPLEALFCCIGDPVVGNPTQLMMEATFRSLAFPARYLTCTVSDRHLREAVGGIKAFGFSGANVTAPHKVAVMEYLDDFTESARLSGAVNCIIARDGRLIGDNTDGKGFLISIEQLAPVKGMRVLVIGAGGAARAIVTELALHGASVIVIANRTVQKAVRIVDRLQPHVSTHLQAVALNKGFSIESGFDLVVQATSVGLFDPDGGLDLTWKHKHREQPIAADVVFNPVRTKFLESAGDTGAITVDGLGMLVHQGAVAITQWTGKEADRTAMRSALEDAFTL